MIRTRRVPFLRSRPSRPLLVSVFAVVTDRRRSSLRVLSTTPSGFAPLPRRSSLCSSPSSSRTWSCVEVAKYFFYKVHAPRRPSRSGAACPPRAPPRRPLEPPPTTPVLTQVNATAPRNARDAPRPDSATLFRSARTDPRAEPRRSRSRSARAVAVPTPPDALADFRTSSQWCSPSRVRRSVDVAEQNRHRASSAHGFAYARRHDAPADFFKAVPSFGSRAHGGSPNPRFAATTRSAQPATLAHTAASRTCALNVHAIAGAGRPNGTYALLDGGKVGPWVQSCAVS